MDKTSGITSVIADCRTCGKSWQNHSNSRQLAFDHAEKTGHKVTVEVSTSTTYNPKQTE